MNPPFAFETIIAFGILSVFLLAGIVLRARLVFLQRFLIPSCLIGGALGLAAIHTGWLPLTEAGLQDFAYHFFVISFISVGLTKSDDNNAEKGLGALRGPLWMAMTQGVAVSVQACIGALGVLAFGWFGTKLYPTFGFFLPLGFTEGPGQALSIGKTWEVAGFEHAATLGLTFAAVGFLFSFFVGVPLVNWGIRRGLAKHSQPEMPRECLTGVCTDPATREEAGRQTMHAGNVDTLAFQAALVGLVYVISYLAVGGLSMILPAEASKPLWGFFFFFGMIFAMLARKIMKLFGVEGLIDQGLQRRITGWAVDYLIVAMVMAVQLVVVWQYVVPITAICLCGGFATLAVALYFGRRLGQYSLERLATVYGITTGTVSSGLLLLRIADPQFKTPVAVEAGVMNIISVPIILASMILVNAPVWWNWSPLAAAGAHLALLAVCVAVMLGLKLIGEKRF